MNKIQKNTIMTAIGSISLKQIIFDIRRTYSTQSGNVALPLSKIANKKTTPNKGWKDLKFTPLNQIFFTKAKLAQYLDKFWDQVMLKLGEDEHVIVIVRVQFATGGFASLGRLQKVGPHSKDKKWLLEYLMHYIAIQEAYYLSESAIKAFIFSHGIRAGAVSAYLKQAEVSDPAAVLKSLKDKVQAQTFKHIKLPITMDPLKYGQVLVKFGETYIVAVTKQVSAHITVHELRNEVKIFMNNTFTLEYTDHISANPESTGFKRVIGARTYFYEDGGLVLHTISRKSRNIRTVPLITDALNDSAKASAQENPVVITYDLETYTDSDGVMVPYCACLYDGTESASFYLSDYANPTAMLTASVEYIFNHHGKNKPKVYVHNLANFDGVFIIKVLAELGGCKPVINDGRIISIEMTSVDSDLNPTSFTFLDSLQILPASLDSLAKSFGVATQKSIFPYDFAREETINYRGFVPDYETFPQSKVSPQDYMNYAINFSPYEGSRIWSMRTETIKYCVIDCIALHQIMESFLEKIRGEFMLEASRYPTASSIASAVFRSNFLPDLNKKGKAITSLSGTMADEIRKGYTGGAVDAYIAYGENVHCYDVNSLYPSVMQTNPMPIGDPTEFFGDIRAVNPEAFGFFLCEIEAPADLKHPILQTHHKTQAGFRTVAPLGKWTDMLFSPEMDNAAKFGYKFKILSGYTFTPGVVFDGYVKDLYALRLSYPKSDPMNLVAKL